jgi:hypothetical protein
MNLLELKFKPEGQKSAKPGKKRCKAVSEPGKRLIVPLNAKEPI